MFREATEEESSKEQELVDDLYDQFLDAVAEGRDMDKAKVKEVATGEVYTARKLHRASASSTSSATSSAPSTSPPSSATRRASPVWLKPRRGLRDVVSSMFATSFVDAVASRIEERLTARFDIQHRL